MLLLGKQYLNYKNVDWFSAYFACLNFTTLTSAKNSKTLTDTFFGHFFNKIHFWLFCLRGSGFRLKTLFYLLYSITKLKVGTIDN